MSDRTTIVLGAGASRAVSYGRKASTPSPLDRDFFDLLQRLEPHHKDSESVTDVLRWAEELPVEYWRSMERSFYTLHSRSYLARKLKIAGSFPTDSDVVTSFVNATGALLRAAHGREFCTHHKRLFNGLSNRDSIVTFNYDLVPERALKEIDDVSTNPFGVWLYGFKADSQPAGWSAPQLLKLHGSFSWDYPKSKGDWFSLRIKKWDQLEEAPGFPRFKEKSTEFPIFLPFWDKKIERPPWDRLWRKAFERIAKCKNLVVWGYSLPVTDIKAHQLFTLALRTPFNLCVIDPSSETRERWRRTFPMAKFWEYSNIDEFFQTAPKWRKP